MKPKVSILIPVYNIAEFIPRCLNCCINQTLKNIEIICVNDGSKDNSLEVLKEFAQKDKRIKIVDKPNGGLPSARNAGLDVASGEYVMFLDGDDWIELEACKKLYRLAKRKNATVVIFGGQVEPLNKETEWTKYAWRPLNKFYKFLSVHDFLTQPNMFPFLVRDFVKNSHIQKNKFRLDLNVGIGEDLAFQFKILPLAKNVVTTSRIIYHYDCSREGSLTNNGKYIISEYKISKHLILLNSLWNDWKNRGLLEKYGGQFFSWAFDFIYWNFAETSSSSKNKLANELLNFFNERGLEKYLFDLNELAKDQYETILSWSKFKKETNKQITVVLNAGANPDFLHFSSFIKSLERYRDLINIEVVMHYYKPLEYIKFEKLCLSNPNMEFTLISDYEAFGGYDDIIETVQTKYITFINYENVLPLLNESISEALKENIDLLCVDDNFEDNPKKLFMSPINNMIFSTSFIKNKKLTFGEYGIFGDLMFKLQLINAEPKTKIIKNLSIPHYEGSKLECESPSSFLHSLNALLKLYELYKKTGNRDYLQLSKRLIENDDFVKSVQKVSFAWHENAIEVVKEIFEKIITLNNIEEYERYYSVNRLLVNFVISAHKQMSQFTKFEYKTRKQLKIASIKS